MFYFRQRKKKRKLQTSCRAEEIHEASPTSALCNGQALLPSSTATELQPTTSNHEPLLSIEVNSPVLHVGENQPESIALVFNENEPSVSTLMEHQEVENPPATDISKKKPRSVKRKIRDVTSWESYTRSKKHQAGESYISRRGSVIPAKKVRNLKDCVNYCKFKCGVSISQNEREAQFKAFYKMSQNEKYHFLLNTTTRTETERPKDKNRNSYKQFSFKYYFRVGPNKIQVCKKWYLGTLQISQKPIYNVHKNKDVETNVPKADGRGKNAKSNRGLPLDIRNKVRDHINSFPKIESHYCRANTNRLYLDSNLNLVKMYNLYKTTCIDEGVQPVKQSMYRHIFVTEYNLDFHMRKSDRCDLCEEYKTAETQNIVTGEQKASYEKHVVEKKAMRDNRKEDRENSKVPVLCFDLENVIACPRAEISSFYYKRKLNTYNLTAHFSQSKTIYCALWTEAISGRSGNDLASALYKILTHLAIEHEFTELILWSDSCVPQNRNSFISCAVQNFLHKHPNIKKITMKYSVPGHSCIQEVDNAHSLIEKGMAHTEFYSPLGLIRILKSINRQHPIRVLQMGENDFYAFGTASKSLNFKLIPFFQVSVLVFTQTLHEVSYKTSFLQKTLKTENLRLTQKPKRKDSVKKGKGNGKIVRQKTPSEESIPVWKLIIPPKLKCKPNLPADKVNDIKDMFRFMPLQDREFYSVVLKL